MNGLRSNREALGVSQIRLARLAGVSRFKICVFEGGDGDLTAAEQARIRDALQAEAKRLRSISLQIDFGQLGSAASGGPR